MPLSDTAPPLLASPLLGPDEPAAFRIAHAHGAAPVLLVCDHATNRVPRALGNLGLPDSELARHIGWDIGAAAVTEGMANRLDAPAVLSGYSRLVVDVNRRLDHPTLMPEVSDGTTVPGNRDLDPANRQRRLDALFHPYHRAIRARLDGFAARGVAPSLISVHSFTPCMAGVARPWHVGVLWNRDPRIAVPLLDALRAEGDLVVGDNEPYSARGALGYTLQAHGEADGLPTVMLEIRQDLIDTDPAADAWADRLTRLLRPILAAL
ncbi:MAG: hypothetical protein RLY86_1505 [Pseudomonadota bacterium]